MLHIVRLFSFYLVACAEDGLYIVGGEGFVAAAEGGRVRYLRQHLLCGTYLAQGGGNAQLAEERLQTVYSRQRDLLLVTGDAGVSPAVIFVVFVVFVGHRPRYRWDFPYEGSTWCIGSC